MKRMGSARETSRSRCWFENRQDPTSVFLGHECTRINLLQQIFNTLGVQHAEAEFFEFGRGSGGQTRFRPTRNRAESLLDLSAQDFPFAFHFPFPFAFLFAFL